MDFKQYYSFRIGEMKYGMTNLFNSTNNTVVAIIDNTIDYIHISKEFFDQMDNKATLDFIQEFYFSYSNEKYTNYSCPNNTFCLLSDQACDKYYDSIIDNIQFEFLSHKIIMQPRAYLKTINIEDNRGDTEPKCYFLFRGPRRNTTC